MQVRNLRQDSRMPSYMIFPRFLAEAELPDTAKIVYMMLLDRARLSRSNEGWTDEQGDVFLNYTIETLSRDLRKSPTTVKTALRELERKGLIRRIRQGIGRPNRIYVRLPQPENGLCDRPKAACDRGGKRTPNKNDRTNRSYQYQEDESL